MSKFVSIAIDGPAGAGKSTMARACAQALGYLYVDTGAIYRTVGYYMRLMGVGPKDKDGIARLIDEVNIDIRYEDGVQHMILNGADVTGEIRTPEAFAQRVERFDYTSFKPYVERMMAGEADVAAPGRVRWFARSSGTTSERSKYLPVTDVSLWRCHTRGLRDVATLYVGQYPSTRVFEGKTLTLGGTCSKSGGIVVGDLSALLVERTPFWSGWFRTPRRETALLVERI